jgi:hypothetical protein
MVSAPGIVGLSGRIDLVSSSVGISTLTDDETLAHLHKWIQVRTEADAQILRGLEHFYQLREHIEYGKYAHDEIAAELSSTTRTAANQLDTAVGLVRRLPDTVDALESGQLDMAKARAILRWTDPLRSSRPATSPPRCRTSQSDAQSPLCGHRASWPTQPADASKSNLSQSPSPLRIRSSVMTRRHSRNHRVW